MFSLRGLIVASLVSLLCNIASAQFTSEARSLSKNYTIPYESLYYHISDVKVIDTAEDSFAFLASYDQNKDSHQKFNLTVETWTADNVTKTSTCEKLNVTNSDFEGFFYSSDEFWPVTPNRVIIFVEVYRKNVLGHIMNPNTAKVQYAIIDVPTCSVVAKLRFPAYYGLPEMKTKLVLYRDSFEIIVSSEHECGGGVERCRIHYDLDGRRIGDPKPYKAPSKHLMLPVSQQVPDKGYYSIQPEWKKYDKFVVSYIDPSGHVKDLMSNISITSEVPIDKSISHVNELFTSCWLYSPAIQYLGGYFIPNSKRVRCLQFDTQGPRKNLTLELAHNTTWVAMRNLADGDLLVITANCDIRPRGPDCKGIRVQRIAADGQEKYKALNVDGLRRKSDNTLIRVQITEKSSGEFCLFWCWKTTPRGNMNLKYETWCAPTNSTLIPEQKRLNAA